MTEETSRRIRMEAPLTFEDLGYLQLRGYDDAGIVREGWFSVPVGSKFESEGGLIETKVPYVGVWCITPNGTKTALQLVNPREKGYRKIKTTQGQYLPIYYATEEDFGYMGLNQIVFLTEGIFDRRALKKVWSNQAVIALLGLGMSERMADWLRLSTKMVFTMLDQDEAGKKATKHILQALRDKGLTVEEIEYAYKDPAEWLAKRGPERMKADLKLQVYRKSWGVCGV